MGRGGGEKSKDFVGSWKKLMGYCKKYLIPILIAVVCAAGGTVFTLVGPDQLSKLTRIITDGGADRFDGSTAPHHHFICTKCHSVRDLPMENIDYIMDTARKAAGSRLRIDSYTAHFYGICENCMGSEENEKAS